MGEVIRLKKARGISGSTLKIIAVVAMVIDHVGASILEHILLAQKMNNLFSVILDPDNIHPAYLMTFTDRFVDTMSVLSVADLICRGIGRLSFPIFIFLMLEGLEHTKNQWKYFGRILLLAVVSEIPYDLAFNSLRADALDFHWANIFNFIDIYDQNVCFTLAIGLLALIGIKALTESQLDVSWKISLSVIISVVGILLAQFLHADYGGFGVLAMIVMYMFRRKKVLRLAFMDAALVAYSITELPCLLSMIPLLKYNGKRGLKLKWIFYVFFPAHLLILWIIGFFVGAA